MASTSVIIKRVSMALVLVILLAIFVPNIIDLQRGEKRRRAQEKEHNSGRHDFGDQPALFAVADAIVRNDQQAIRAAAAAVPDLQAPGRDGTTLLSFAVTSSWQRPELVDSVKTLLELGANPNHTNGHSGSFALANAVHASAPVLRAMLDAGGDPNARDQHGKPMIALIWYLGYFRHDERARLDLLLERGADVNSAFPASTADPGYTALLYRMKSGPDHDDGAYADALYLLERGADPQHAAADGMSFGKMLMEHRDRFTREKKKPSRNFEALWEWAQAKGLVS